VGGPELLPKRLVGPTSASQVADGSSAWRSLVEADAVFQDADAVFQEAARFFRDAGAVSPDADTALQDADAVFQEADMVVQDANTDAVFQDTDAFLLKRGVCWASSIMQCVIDVPEK